MKALSSLASAFGLLALVISAPGHAAPPVKPPPMSARVHTVIAGVGGNVCTNDGSSTVLDIALANGNPNVAIIATHNTADYSGGPSFISVPGVLTVYYDESGLGCGTSGRWIVNNENAAASNLVNGQRINIIVAAP